MAEKRMYSKKITDSDAFIEMASSAQALYFHLNQGADDDGFNNQIQIAILKAHASIDDLKVLLAKNFIMRFESGVVVIKHWWIHNTLRKDRYTPTNFQEELNLLGIKDNRAYTLDKESCERLPNGCQTVATVESSIDKIRLDEIIKEKDIEKENSEIPNKVRKKFVVPTYEEVEQFASNRGRKDLAMPFYEYFTTGEWKDSEGKPVKNWKQKFITWENHNPQKDVPKKNTAVHFKQERKYTDDEFERLYADVDDIEI